jgi:hypothetical protein
MASSYFIGIESSELSGNLIDNWIKNFYVRCRQVGAPKYIITGIDYDVYHSTYKKVVIGDWK